MNIKKKMKVTAAERISAAVTDSYDFTDRVKFGKNRYRIMYTGVNTEASAESMFNDFRFQISVSTPYDDADYAWCYGDRGVIKIIKSQKVIHKAFYFNADDMDVENTEWCDEVVRIALGELEKINERIEQRIIHNSRKISADSTVEAATFKNDRRLSTTSERYKGYLIVLDRGGDGYNVYDKNRELEDAGYPSREAAKKFIDELVANDDVYSSESIEDDEDDIKTVDQEYDSANTSINSTKLPAIYNMVNFPKGAVVLDYGGGKFDNAVAYLESIGCKGYVYDPYNRSAEHNREVIKTIRANGGADITLCSNVLNVIKEPEARQNVLENIKKLTKPSGKVYITVYEGKGDGAEGPTKSGYQLNRKTAGYVDEVKEVFPEASRKGKLICASYQAKLEPIKQSCKVSPKHIKSSRNETLLPEKVDWYELDWDEQIQLMQNYVRQYKGSRIFEDFAEYVNIPVEDIIDDFCDAEYREYIVIPERMQLDSEYRNDDIYSSSSVDANTDEYSRVDASSRTVNSSKNIKSSSEIIWDDLDWNQQIQVMKRYIRNYKGTRIFEDFADYINKPVEDIIDSFCDAESYGDIKIPERKQLDSEYRNDDIYSSTTLSDRYWYFTRHGVQPGSVPKYVNILDIVDKPEGSYFLADGVILTNDLRDYDIKERKPEDSVTSSTRIKSKGNNQYTDADLQDIAEKIEAVVVAVIMQDEGFDESEAKMYSRVTISDIDDNGLYIEVGAEVGYESLERICSECDKVIQALPGVDENSYFEPIEPGLAGCYVYSK